MRFFVRALGALLLTSSVALAGPPDDGKGHGAGNGKGHGPGTGQGSGEGDGKGKGDGKGEGKRKEHATDAGAAVKRTPEQNAFRQALLDKKHKLVSEIVHRNGKHTTKAEHNAVRTYWRHVTRLLRVRELAQEAKDDASVKRVDALLAKAEKNITTKLEKMNAEAPAAAAPAASGATAPAAPPAGGAK
jgi:hypothetical protein